jgi:predicted PurR-regulated permease PerM
MDPAPRRPRVPPLLDDAAGWAWRLLVTGTVIYVIGALALRLELVVVPLLTALLLSALLEPVFKRLNQVGLPRSVAAVLTVLLALAVLGGVTVYVVSRATTEYPQLVDQISRLVMQGQHWLSTGPLKLRTGPVTSVGDQLVQLLRSRESEIASGVLSASRTVADVLTALILTLFLTIFMLYDGRRIWGWLTGLAGASARGRTDYVGEQMWQTISGYVTGTFLVAAFHGVVMGLTLLLVGVPLVAPLALLVFLGSFLPLIGAVVFGGLAVLVTLVSNGVTAALIVLVVLVVENQIEGHVLQPFVVGKHVRLHPMAIALTITAGAVLAGLPGAIFSVPLVATINAAVRALRHPEPPEDDLPAELPMEQTAGPPLAR